jgi:hypothetical protein
MVTMVKNEAVWKMCETQLAENPSVVSRELYESAIALDESIRQLSPRQFHAAYPLQIARGAKIKALANGNGQATEPKPRMPRKLVAATDRAAIRAILLELIEQTAAAARDDLTKLIRITANVDEVVDRVVSTK